MLFFSILDGELSHKCALEAGNCMESCSNETIVDSCDDFNDMKVNGCLSTCPPCVHETIAAFMDCGKVLLFLKF